MDKRFYYINRYFGYKNHRLYSGYEFLYNGSEDAKHWPRSNTLNIILRYLFKRFNKNSNYLWNNSSIEIVTLLMAILTKKPVHYLYADKDIYFGFFIKKYFPKRLTLYGTYHWSIDLINPNDNYYYLAFDKIIVMGQKFRLELTQYFACIKFIPHGIYKDFWKRDIPYDKNSRYVLILGESNRNHFKQIEMMKSLKVMNKDLKFIVKCNLNFELRNEYLKINDTQVIDQFMTDKELKNLYQNSCCILLVQDHCIASNVVLEAMALGVPLITNKVGDISDYLYDNYPLYLDSGFSFDLNNINMDIISSYLIAHSEKFVWKLVRSETTKFLYKQ